MRTRHNNDAAGAGLLAAIALATVTLALAWIVTAGWMTRWPTYMNGYGMLADAFLHGQTSLRVKPAPALLALSDPYNPDLNAPYRLHDMSLYRGRYYMYWGPLPAVLEMPVVAWLKRPIGDQYLAFVLAVGLTAISAAILLTVRRRWFLDSAPAWTLGLGIVVAGLAMPLPFLMARAATYEVAVLGGQFFLLAGLYAAFAAPPPVGKARLAWAGICWSMAVGSRVSLAPAVAALCAAAAWRLCRRSRDPSPGRAARFELPRLASLITPVALTAALLGYYNHVRFGSWREFGQVYQLGAYNLLAVRDHLFSPANIPPALYAYLLKPLEFRAAFPFVKAAREVMSFPAWVPMPSDYEGREPTTGVVWCLPILVFVAAAIGRALRRTPSPDTDLADADRNAVDPRRGSDFRWLTGMLLLASLLGSAPVMLLNTSTMRYLTDITPSLTLLATIGLWSSMEGQPAKARRRILTLFTALANYSISIGILLALNGPYRHFHTNHPGYLGL